MKLLLLSSMLIAATAMLPASAEDTAQVVEHLLQQVKSSDSVFIRNGSEHTPAEAADHMRKKYEHFRKKIKTPEDFIRLSATQSLITKKKYRMRLKDGREMDTRDYMLDLLKQYRVKASESSPSS